MWIVETPSNGKTRALKLNTVYQVGRKVTGGSKTDNAFVLAGKYVSRDHSTIQVKRKAEGGSIITITNNKAKAGTFVGETQIKDEFTLEGNPIDSQTFTVVFGKADAEGNSSLVFKYLPMGLVYSNSDKTESGQSYKDAIQSLIGDIDFQVLMDFPTPANWTVYFVKSNRNTSKTLIALAQGIPIVTLDFVKDASKKLENSVDFNADLPDPTKYLPEPAMAVDSRRKTCFDGITFIFVDRDQFDSMIQPIAGAGGEAKFYDIQAGLQVRPLMDFVEKNGSGVLVKVPRPVNNVSASTINRVLGQVSHLFGLEPVEQKKFLDAILKCDASILRVQYNERPATRVSSATTSSRRLPSTEVRRDSDNPNNRAKSKSSNTENVSPVTPHEETASSSSSVLSSGKSLPQVPNSNEMTTTTTTRRKPREHSQTVDFMDFMLGSSGTAVTATTTSSSQQTAMALDRAHDENAQSMSSPMEANSTGELVQVLQDDERPRKRIRVDLSPVQESEGESEPGASGQEIMAADKENEAPIEELRDLGIEETFPVMPIEKKNQTEKQRWNSKWNGRNNFKGFRRRNNVITSGKILQEKEYIPLIEQEPPDHGVNDHAWFTSTTENKNNNKRAQSKSPGPRTSKMPRAQVEPSGLFVGLSDDDDEEGEGEGGESVIPDTHGDDDDDDDDDVDGLRLRFRRNR